MGDASTKQIEILAFSPAFENMCNFVAIAKIGDPSETIRGLIKLCLLELPGEKFEEAQDFHKVIEVLFGLTVSISQIETALSELQKKYIIKRTGNTNFQLEHNVSLALREAIQHSQIIENTVKLAWFNEITDQYPDLPTDIAWQLLRDYLCRIFRRHGIQAAALLDPTIDTPTEYVSSLSLILQQVIKDNKIDDKQIQKTAEKAISGFMADLGSNSNRAIYITQLADGAFNYYTLGIPTDLSKLLRQNLEAITLFLDTNFLFGILDLHYNTQVQVSHDLLRSISEHKLPFKLCYHVATQREMNNTIGYYSSMLRPYDWSISLSRAAIMSLNISGIEQKFHQLNAQGLVDVDEFLRPYEHLDYMLKEKKIKVFRPIEDRISARTDLYHDYQLFLENNNRGDKTYETIMHDAILLEEARHLRSDAASSLQAGALIISCDYLLYRFDWESSRKSGQRACVLLPNIFWQIIRPFIPTDQDFEKAFAETFALPEFRAMNSGGSKACSKMLQILASYKDVPEQTAIKLLTNDILLDKLRVERDDARFNQQVEAAFVEVNRDLIEEKASYEQELKRQKEINKKELKKRTIEKQEHDKRIKDIKETAKKEIRDAKQLIKVVDEEKKIETEARIRAEKSSFRANFALGLVTGLLIIAILISIVYLMPIAWIATHNNIYLIFLTVSASILCFSFGLFVKEWRMWCWGVGLLAFLSALIPLFAK